jgi:hypothetical protein
MISVFRSHMRRDAALTPDLVLAVALIGLDVFARLVPHTLHFTPVAASALFAAATLRRRGFSLAVPLIALALSDAVLGFYDWRVMAVVYAASAAPAAIALCVGRLRSPFVLLVLACTSSVVFFLATNFAVWAFEAMYPRDLAGLGACYVTALPFFKNTIAGDLFWTCVLFGGRELFHAFRPAARASA